MSVFKEKNKKLFRVIASEPDGSPAQKGAIDALISYVLRDERGRATPSGADRPLGRWSAEMVHFNCKPEGFFYLAKQASFNLGSAVPFLLPEENEGREILWRALDADFGWERNKISALQRLLRYTPAGASDVNFKEFFQALAARPAQLYNTAFKAALPVLLMKGMHEDVPEYQDWIDVLDVEAGLQLLNAQPVDRVSDAEIFNILVESTPESWCQSDDGPHWASHSRVSGMLTILFTNRPGLAEMAMGNPELCKAAMKTPHWDNSFLESLPGIKLEDGSYKYDAETETSGSPFIFLSLTWKPTTSLEVTSIIQAVTEEAIAAGSLYASDWMVTQSAASRKREMGVEAIGSWNSFSQDAVDGGATRRIESRIMSAFRRDQRALIGPCHLEEDFSLTQDSADSESYDYLSFQWSDKLPEVIAMANNPLMQNAFFDHWTNIHAYQILGNCPRGSWTRSKIMQAGRDMKAWPNLPADPRDESPYQVLNSLNESKMAKMDENFVPSSMRNDRSVKALPGFGLASEPQGLHRRSHAAVEFLKREVSSDENLQEAVSVTLTMLLDSVWDKEQPETVAETALATIC